MLEWLDEHLLLLDHPHGALSDNWHEIYQRTGGTQRVLVEWLVDIAQLIAGSARERIDLNALDRHPPAFAGDVHHATSAAPVNAGRKRGAGTPRKKASKAAPRRAKAS